MTRLTPADVGGPKCDFDSERPVVAAYHAADFVSIAGVAGSEGAWAACAACAALVDADDRAGLVDRSVAGFVARRGPLDEPKQTAVRRFIEDLHAQFWTSRVGDRVDYIVPEQVEQ